MMMMMTPSLSISPFQLYCSILPITLLTTNVPDSPATDSEQFRTIQSHISERFLQHTHRGYATLSNCGTLTHD